MIHSRWFWFYESVDHFHVHHRFLKRYGSAPSTDKSLMFLAITAVLIYQVCKCCCADTALLVLWHIKEELKMVVVDDDDGCCGRQTANTPHNSTRRAPTQQTQKHCVYMLSSSTVNQLLYMFIQYKHVYQN